MTDDDVAVTPMAALLDHLAECDTEQLDRITRLPAFTRRLDHWLVLARAGASGGLN
jgi:hypothetical protein